MINLIWTGLLKTKYVSGKSPRELVVSLVMFRDAKGTYLRCGKLRDLLIGGN